MKYDRPYWGLLAALAFLFSHCGQQPYQQGAILYQNFCANCHMDDGQGLAGNIPPLAGADYVRDNQELLPCIIRYGQEGAIVVNGTTYSNPMAAIPQLTEFEIANIINYINHSWGNDYGYAKMSDIREALKNCTRPPIE